MSYPVLDVCEYIIEYSNYKGFIVSNLKLQKLLYFIQAEFMVAKNQPCFGEKIVAASWGAMVPAAYKRYKVFGGAHIPCVNAFFECHTFGISQSDRDLIDGIVNACEHYTASQLVEINHCQSPWKDAYNQRMLNEITPKALKDFFGGNDDK